MDIYLQSGCYLNIIQISSIWFPVACPWWVWNGCSRVHETIDRWFPGSKRIVLGSTGCLQGFIPVQLPTSIASYWGDYWGDRLLFDSKVRIMWRMKNKGLYKNRWQCQKNKDLGQLTINTMQRINKIIDELWWIVINPNPHTPFPQCSRMWLVDIRPLIGRARTGFPLPMKLQNYLSLDLNLFSTSSSLTHFTFRFIFCSCTHSVL